MRKFTLDSKSRERRAKSQEEAHSQEGALLPRRSLTPKKEPYSQEGASLPRRSPLPRRRPMTKKPWCPRRQHQRLLPRFWWRCLPSKPWLKICNDNQSTNVNETNETSSPGTYYIHMYLKMRPKFLANIKDLAIQQQASKNTR
jgi:hypothetical protein